MDKLKKIFFASDVHLGTPNDKESFAREKKFIAWLDEIYPQCSQLFLVGDIFDFWFDYPHVVPKGFVRLLAKLAQFTDNGIPVHFFKGNHDMWLDGYFEKEFGFTIHDDNFVFKQNGYTFFVGHGDGKGPKDYKYKLLKKVFRNSFSQFLFRWIHPNIGMGLAQFWSRRSRYGGMQTEEVFLGEEKEWLIQYIKRKHPIVGANYYIFGHRHLALFHPIDGNTTYVNLGDWLRYKSYAVFDGEKIELCYYD